MRLLPILVASALLGTVPQTEAQCYSQYPAHPVFVQPRPVVDYHFGSGFQEQSRFYAKVKYGNLGWKTVPIINGIAPMVCVTGNHTSYDYRHGKPYKSCVRPAKTAPVAKTVPRRPPIVTESRTKWKAAPPPKVVEPKPKAPSMHDNLADIQRQLKALREEIKKLPQAPKVGPGQREPSKILDPDKRITPNYHRRKSARGVFLVVKQRIV